MAKTGEGHGTVYRFGGNKKAESEGAGEKRVPKKVAPLIDRRFTGRIRCQKLYPHEGADACSCFAKSGRRKRNSPNNIYPRNVAAEGTSGAHGGDFGALWLGDLRGPGGHLVTWTHWGQTGCRTPDDRRLENTFETCCLGLFTIQV